jgi:hypothetical protein
MTPLIRIFLILGVVFLVIGGVLYVAGRFNISIPFGRLPGDIRIERDGFIFYFPLVSCILGSIFLTILLNLIGRFWKR